jgi:hypothetical protein
VVDVDFNCLWKGGFTLIRQILKLDLFCYVKQMLEPFLLGVLRCGILPKCKKHLNYFFFTQILFFHLLLISKATPRVREAAFSGRPWISISYIWIVSTLQTEVFFLLHAELFLRKLLFDIPTSSHNLYVYLVPLLLLNDLRESLNITIKSHSFKIIRYSETLFLNWKWQTLHLKLCAGSMRHGHLSMTW